MGKRSRDGDEVSTTSSHSISRSAESPAKIIELDESGDDITPSDPKMQCLLPPHQPLSFTSTEEFDVHYAKEHTNRCTSCGKNFPSAHYLALHIDENHNPVREALAAKGEKTYACFVEGCEKKCSTPQKRRLHLIDKHMFPKVYNFRIIDRGIDKADSMLHTGPKRRLSTNTSRGHRRRVSTLSGSTAVDEEESLARSDANKPESEPTKVKDSKLDIEDLEKSMAALRFVPPSVRSKQRPKKTIS
ncbi:hypothetical protein H2198_007077 [Neophaeococcomyces mojaviensis]|uniref:Uncharacterized protein n=1 Tax=Neophaeococcomyces mojaviensis TaxID=3383035 RepID=A0ACC3A1Q0_9EURO|nr:hypothetical protein H2198_007077 [Knufia sp. JES_112]